MAISLAAITRALPAGYAARFVAADDPATDSEVAILLHGAPTRWALQLGNGYIGVNEYGFENGQLEWVQPHGLFRTIRAATAKLASLLAKETADGS